MKLTCVLVMVGLAAGVAAADAPKKQGKPEAAAKAWLTKMTTGKDVAAASKDKPIAFWKSANAIPEACEKLGTFAVVTTADQMKLVKKCLQDEIKGRAIADRDIRQALLDLPMSVVEKSHQKAMKDAAVNATIIEAAYNRDDATSAVYFAVAPDLSITAIWLNSNETE